MAHDMPNRFRVSLSKLEGETVQVFAADEAVDDGSALLLFANGSRLRSDYWRIFQHGKGTKSSFDHNQQYGLPEKIDAIKALQEVLEGKVLEKVRLDEEAGDLIFEFDDDIRIQVLKFTGYEVWEISFPDGTGEYSNHV